MDYAKSMSGVAPFKMGFQINETLANAGIPVLEPPGNGAGVAISTTTSWAKAVGVTLDTATYVAAQQTDGTSAEREVTVIINPDAIFRALMSGGAAEGTALSLYPITTAASDGLTLTTASIADWSSPAFDESVAWFYDGANAGQKRKVTSVSSSVATVTVPFDNGTVEDDNVLRAPYWFLGDAQTIQTTTNLYQANVAIAVATGGTAKIIDMELRDQSDDGRTKSFVLFLLDDHALKTL